MRHATGREPATPVPERTAKKFFRRPSSSSSRNVDEGMPHPRGGFGVQSEIRDEQSEIRDKFCCFRARILA